MLFTNEQALSMFPTAHERQEVLAMFPHPDSVGPDEVVTTAPAIMSADSVGVLVPEEECFKPDFYRAWWEWQNRMVEYQRQQEADQSRLAGVFGKGKRP